MIYILNFYNLHIKGSLLIRLYVIYRYEQPDSPTVCTWPSGHLVTQAHQALSSHRITDVSFYLSPWKVEITMLLSTSMIQWLTVDIDQT